MGWHECLKFRHALASTGSGLALNHAHELHLSGRAADSRHAHPQQMQTASAGVATLFPLFRPTYKPNHIFLGEFLNTDKSHVAGRLR